MRRGFSIAEVLVAMSCLIVLSVGLFAMFDMCSTNFHVGLARQNLQSELLTFATRFKNDVRQTSFYGVLPARNGTLTVELEPGISNKTTTVYRDAVSLPALKTPDANSSYDVVSGRPQWDCYWVYFATLDQPVGNLIRYRYDSGLSTIEPYPISNFDPPISLAKPAAVPKTIKTLSHNLYNFVINVDDTNQYIEVTVSFRSTRGHTTAGKRSLSEIAEAKLRVKAENSWPRL